MQETGPGTNGGCLYIGAFPLSMVSWDTPASLATSSLVSIGGLADFCGTAPIEAFYLYNGMQTKVLRL